MASVNNWILVVQDSHLKSINWASKDNITIHWISLSFRNGGDQATLPTWCRNTFPFIWVITISFLVDYISLQVEGVISKNTNILIVINCARRDYCNCFNCNITCWYITLDLTWSSRHAYIIRAILFHAILSRCSTVG